MLWDNQTVQMHSEMCKMLCKHMLSFLKGNNKIHLKKAKGLIER